MISAVRNMKISFKLPIIMLLLTIASVALVSYYAIKTASDELVVISHNETNALRDQSFSKLDMYLKGLDQDLLVIAHSGEIKNALAAFEAGWAALEAENKTVYLQNEYIDKNANKAGEKHLLNAATDGSAYSVAHAEYHPWMRELLTSKGLYDIFLFDKEGNIVYTVFKERDFATNAVTGQWKDSDIMALFRDIKANPKNDEIKFYDFAEYAPSNNVPAAFIGTAILSKEGEFLGVLAYQMPIGKINETLFYDKAAETGMEVHLIGEDHKLRNDPDPKDNVDPMLKETMGHSNIDACLKGEESIAWTIDDGEEVLASCRMLEYHGTKLVVLVDIIKADVFHTIEEMKSNILVKSVLILIAIAIIAFFFSRSLTNPINNMVGVMGKLADKNYAVEVPSLDRGDEIGGMARAVQVFKENGLAIEKMEAEQEALKRRAEEDKRAAMNKLADDFDSRTAGIISALASAATEMQATAGQMTSASQNTAHSSSIVASAATEADSNVQTVASAAEELSASSSEIAKQIAGVAQKSNRASQEATTTSQEVSELNSLADSIGEVVGAIKDIAEQTNLLALNATIEAARAGEAGKGFAVVADEVKKLAMETAQKTEQIDERVVKIQQAIRSSVEAVQRIINDVQQIDEATTAVAGAVEEQNAATAEIGRNVAEASTGTQQVAQNILSVQKNAEETGNAAGTVQTAAEELARISEELQREVGVFLNEIRSSGRG